MNYESNCKDQYNPKELVEMGYALAYKEAKLLILGLAEGILIDRRNKIIYGADDPRGGGLAIGY